MAVEAKRGCGYRKVGGLYLVGGGIGIACDRLPFELTVCPCCSNGFKPTLGFTWIRPSLLFEGAHVIQTSDDGSIPCPERSWISGSKKGCWLCNDPSKFEKAGMIWIGERFYKTPQDFIAEGVAHGFSRRIGRVPHGFKIGETPLFLAHRKAVQSSEPDVKKGKLFSDKPGIFYVWIPTKLEMIFKESARGTDEVKAAEKRNISPVFVPDNDKDHQGRVYDKEEE